MNKNCDNCRNNITDGCKYENKCFITTINGVQVGSPAYWATNEEEISNEEHSTFDEVNKPSHYCEGRKYEPVAVIQDWELDFCLGNTVKYISRAGRKKSGSLSDNEKQIQDLEKAKFYLDYEIKLLKGEIN